ncbi:MAG: hypothetical protein GX160_00300 [Clostridiales bacterium]|jgi:hypothetical protein|nr:hypothetical protein [Clostridiales bacterium]
MLKSIIRPIIILWEKIFERIENIEVVPNSPYGLLRMAVHPYKGQPTVLSDGTRLNTGDYVIELHISNLVLVKGKVGDVEVANNIRLLPLFREEMHNLAGLASHGKLDPRAKAIWGVTMMGPGLKRLGFQLEPMDHSTHSRLLVMWMNFLKWVFYPTQLKPSSKHKSRQKGYQYFMSIEQLIRRYAPSDNQS